MNDTFKIAFRIFDKKRVDMLKEIQQNKPDRFVSLEDHGKVLEALWDDFPWIVGPLTGAGDKKAVIAVVTTSVKSPDSLTESRKKTQAGLSRGSKTTTRTVTPLIKYLEEAVSSGSVLPFHAIDGAEMARTLISSSDPDSINATAAIHDAVIAPLNKSDIVGFNYQKSMADTNTNYVLVDSIESMVTRMSKTLNSDTFEKDFKNVTVNGLKTLDKEDSELKFPDVAKKVTGQMSILVGEVNSARQEWYGEGGKLEGAQYGNLVSTPGAMYKSATYGKKEKSTSEPNLQYKKEFKDKQMYKNTEVKMQNKVAPKLSYSEYNAGNISVKTSITYTNAASAAVVNEKTEGC